VDAEGAQIHLRFFESTWNLTGNRTRNGESVMDFFRELVQWMNENKMVATTAAVLGLLLGLLTALVL
jgi:uncharacterized membrane protein SpoIIM required for sporulation